MIVVVLSYLISGVVADHVALAAIDAHVLVHQRHHLLLVVQIAIRSDLKLSSFECRILMFYAWKSRSIGSTVGEANL